MQNWKFAFRLNVFSYNHFQWNQTAQLVATPPHFSSLMLMELMMSHDITNDQPYVADHTLIHLNVRLM